MRKRAGSAESYRKKLLTGAQRLLTGTQKLLTGTWPFIAEVWAAERPGCARVPELERKVGTP